MSYRHKVTFIISKTVRHTDMMYWTQYIRVYFILLCGLCSKYVFSNKHLANYAQDARINARKSSCKMYIIAVRNEPNFYNVIFNPLKPNGICMYQLL
jgi:hypothetical protein